MTGAVLDSGALVGFERNDRRIVAIVRRAVEHGDSLVLPAAVVGQCWRDGRRQARLARLLGSLVCLVEPLDDTDARAAGQLLGVAGTADVVDATVAVVARRRGVGVVTSDADDIHRLDAGITLYPV
ncbi:MAG: PIN domain-containing protein [Acidimicrobiales bacterium]